MAGDTCLRQAIEGKQQAITEEGEEEPEMGVAPLLDKENWRDGLQRVLEHEARQQDAPGKKGQQERTRLLQDERQTLGESGLTASEIHQVSTDEEEQAHIGNAYHLVVYKLVGKHIGEVLHHDGEDCQASHPIYPF